MHPQWWSLVQALRALPLLLRCTRRVHKRCLMITLRSPAHMCCSNTLLCMRFSCFVLVHPCSQVGIPVRVLEQNASGTREEGSAIGLWDNAWCALDALGVADSLRPSYLRLRRYGGRGVCMVHGVRC